MNTMADSEIEWNGRTEESGDVTSRMPQDVDAFLKHPLVTANHSQQGMALLHEFQIFSGLSDPIQKHGTCQKSRKRISTSNCNPDHISKNMMLNHADDDTYDKTSRNVIITSNCNDKSLNLSNNRNKTVVKMDNFMKRENSFKTLDNSIDKNIQPIDNSINYSNRFNRPSLINNNKINAENCNTFSDKNNFFENKNINNNVKNEENYNMVKIKTNMLNKSLFTYNKQVLEVPSKEKSCSKGNNLQQIDLLPFNEIITESNELLTCDSMEIATKEKKISPLATKTTLTKNSQPLSNLRIINEKAQQFLQKLANVPSNFPNEHFTSNASSNFPNGLFSSKSVANTDASAFKMASNSFLNAFSHFQSPDENNTNIPEQPYNHHKDQLAVSVDLSTSTKLESSFRADSQINLSPSSQILESSDQIKNFKLLQTPNPLTIDPIGNETFKITPEILPPYFETNKYHNINTSNVTAFRDYLSSDSRQETMTTKVTSDNIDSSCNDFLSKIPPLPFPLPSVPLGYRLVITHLPIHNNQQPDSKNITQLIIDNPKKTNNLLKQASSQPSPTNNKPCDFIHTSTETLHNPQTILL